MFQKINTKKSERDSISECNYLVPFVKIKDYATNFFFL